MIKRHLFHHEGMTDRKVMEHCAASAGEPAVLHLHPHTENHQSCHLLDPELHIVYPKEVTP